jgi:signal transduction histidine kinase
MAPIHAPSLISFFGAFCVRPGDDSETWTRKAQFTLAMTVIVPAGLIWALLYFAFGAHFAALLPLAYSVLSLANLLILRETRQFRFFQITELALILILPFLLQLALGGFVSGSAVVIWSLLCPLFAVMFTGPREASVWFLLFLGLLLAAGLLQPSLALTGELPAWLVSVLFVMNVGAVSTIAFAMLVSFVRARERLRGLEIAYLEQSVMLRQREKLATLGTLAAGVAHELNNPAAAVRRSAEQLLDSLAEITRGVASLASLGGFARHCQAIVGRGTAKTPERRSPLQVSSLEEDLEGWLEDRGIEGAAETATALVAAGCGVDEIEKATAELDPALVGPAIRFMGEAATAVGLGQNIGEGARRISEIVAALRSYSYVDRGTWQMVDIVEGLESTLTLLGAKLRDMHVERQLAADVPRVEARGSELNQVWTNVIDNAIDATGGKGRLTLRAFADGATVVVEIEDDGPGMPAEIAEKVFDPFFTTKPPGRGTGLGLNISYNIVVNQHAGQIGVASEPGRTCFRIALPLQQVRSAEQSDRQMVSLPFNRSVSA